MNVKTAVAAAFIFWAGSCFVSSAREQEQNGHHQQRLREMLQLRQEMRRIEQEAIEEDSELRTIVQEIRDLNTRLREKLDESLKGNEEYQELKERSDSMREDWRRRREETFPHEGKERDKTRERRRRTDR